MIKFCTDGGSLHEYDDTNTCFACGEPMSPSQQAKAAGLKSLTQVSNITHVSLNTLGNWHRDKPDLFRVVLVGSMAIVEKETA